MRNEMSSMEMKFRHDNTEFRLETYKDGELMTISMENVDTLAFNTWSFLTYPKSDMDEVRIRVATEEEIKEWYEEDEE